MVSMIVTESMSWLPDPYAALFLCCCIVSTGGVFYYDNTMNMKMFEAPGEIKKYESQSEELMKKLKVQIVHFFEAKGSFFPDLACRWTLSHMLLPLL